MAVGQDEEYANIDGQEECVENGAPATQQPEEKEVCRDFKKGDCRRGSKCIYHHPKLNICKDFQSQKCARENCKYMHVTREEEERYINSGILPDRLNNGPFLGNNRMGAPPNVGVGMDFGRRQVVPGLPQMQVMYGQQQNNPLPEQICRDFEKGDCRRGARCKFSHPKLKICRDFQKEKCEREKCRFLHMTREEEETYEGNGIIPDHLDKEEVKKKRVPLPSVGGAVDMFEMYGKRRREDNFESPSVLSHTPLAAVLQENERLKLKITEMQQQITDLRKMNDTLYDQNNKYRYQTSAAIGGMQKVM